MTLYLGFSGVLHPQYAEKKDQFHWAPLLSEILEEVDPDGKIQIVISSDWAWLDSLDKAKACLPEPLRVRVADTTLDRSLAVFDTMTVGRMIATHANSHGIGRWVAVDEDDKFWPDEFRGRLVKTDSMLGLGSTEAQQELKTRLQELFR